MAYTGTVPDTAARRRDWTQQAACASKNLNTFFERKHEQEARTLCTVHCPVRAMCLKDVMDVERGTSRDHRHGIFAGLDSIERWRLDPTAVGHADDGSTMFTTDGPPPECGTPEALLRHLALGQPVDDRCWSGHLRRTHTNIRKNGIPAPAPEPSAKTGPECGSEQGWYLHRRRKEQCQVCEEAHDERVVARRREVLAEEHVKGGSERGYVIHRRLGEPPCDLCTEGARRDRQARLEREAARPKRDGLNAREQWVRGLWEQGLSDSEIARRVGVSRSGVGNIRRRLGLTGVPGTVRLEPSTPTAGPRGQTARERRVWALWAAGCSDFEIARRMAAAVPWVGRVRERLGLTPNLHVRKASVSA